MSVTLQVQIDGGGAASGTVLCTVGQTVQPLAASYATWGSPVGRWDIYDFPVGFAAPAGYTYDATNESYYWLGNGQPPSFDPDPWGAYMIKVVATDGSVVTEDKLKVLILSPSGIADMGRGEGALDGGPNKRWVGPLQENLRIIDAGLGGGTVAGAFTLSGDANLTLSAGSNDNQALGASVSTLRVDAAAGATLTGLTGGADGRIVLLANVDAADGFNISHDATSTAANRFYLSGGGVVHVPIRSGIFFRYDATTSRWHHIAGGQASALRAASITSTEGLTLASDGVEPVTVNGGAGGIDLDTDVITLTGCALVAPTVACSLIPTTSAGVGKTLTLRAGPAAAGSVGGNCTVGPSDGGTPATNAPGNLLIEVGTAVANVSGKTIWQEAGTQIAIAQRTASGWTHRAGTGNPFSGSGGLNYFNIEGFGGTFAFPTTELVISGAGLNVSSTYLETGGQMSSAVDSVAFAASTTIDARNGNHHHIAQMTADMTALTFSNIRACGVHYILFQQDAAVARTVTPNANFKASAAYALTIDATLSYYTLWTIRVRTATSWDLVNRQVFAT